jgi:prepilin-type N-terminal cleavage/methylation domain-containing protein
MANQKKSTRGFTPSVKLGDATMSRAFSTSPSSTAGFTLLEVLLSVAVIALLAGISMPVYELFYSSNQLDLDTQTVVEQMDRAESYARASVGDSDWGVRLEQGSVILFQGSSYGSGDPDLEESADISPSTTWEGQDEFIFLKYTGLPFKIEDVKIIANEDFRTISVNTNGTISY